MRGPLIVTALPADLSGITIELAVGLHRAAMARGHPVDSQHRLLVVKTPLKVCVLATTLPDQMRMTVSRLPGAIVLDQAVMIFLTADGHNYLLLDATIDIEELAAIAAQLGSEAP